MEKKFNNYSEEQWEAMLAAMREVSRVLIA